MKRKYNLLEHWDDVFYYLKTGMSLKEHEEKGSSFTWNDEDKKTALSIAYERWLNNRRLLSEENK